MAAPTGNQWLKEIIEIIYKVVSAIFEETKTGKKEKS